MTEHNPASPTDDRLPGGLPRVVLYTTAWCGFCRAAKQLLEELDVPYRELDVTRDSATRARVRVETGWPTVPVVLLDGELVGGFTELAALAKRGGLGSPVG